MPRQSRGVGFELHRLPNGQVVATMPRSVIESGQRVMRERAERQQAERQPSFLSYVCHHILLPGAILGSLVAAGWVLCYMIGI